MINKSLLLSLFIVSIYVFNVGCAGAGKAPSSVSNNLPPCTAPFLSDPTTLPSCMTESSPTLKPLSPIYELEVADCTLCADASSKETCTSCAKTTEESKCVYSHCGNSAMVGMLNCNECTASNDKALCQQCVTQYYCDRTCISNCADFYCRAI